jgi:hypothetical protein
MAGERFSENPFYILGLRPDCSRADLEREGQKLLAMLELKLEAARSYPTPLGPMPRTADSVRQAMAELRDPQRRLLHELWAQLPASPLAGEPPRSAGPLPDSPGDSAAPTDAAGPPPPWPQARAALGFGARR